MSICYIFSDLRRLGGIEKWTNTFSSFIKNNKIIYELVEYPPLKKKDIIIVNNYHNIDILLPFLEFAGNIRCRRIFVVHSDICPYNKYLCNNIDLFDEIISVSQSIYQKFKNIFPSKEHHLIENFIDTDNIIQIKRELQNPIRLSFVGRVSREKCIPTILFTYRQLIKKNINVILNIYGKCDETYIKCIHFIVENLQLPNVIFHGRITDQNEIYNNTDILILPSVSEGLPYVILEALARGIPVVTTKIGSVSDIVIDDVNGYLIDISIPNIQDPYIDDYSLLLRFMGYTNTYGDNIKITDKNIHRGCRINIPFLNEYIPSVMLMPMVNCIACKYIQDLQLLFVNLINKITDDIEKCINNYDILANNYYKCNKIQNQYKISKLIDPKFMSQFADDILDKLIGEIVNDLTEND